MKQKFFLQISDHQQSVTRLLRGVFLIPPALLVVADLMRRDSPERDRTSCQMEMLTCMALSSLLDGSRTAIDGPGKLLVISTRGPVGPFIAKISQPHAGGDRGKVIEY